MYIKENIDYILKQKGMTKMALADQMGISNQLLNTYTKDSVSVKRLEKVALALGTTVADLLSDPPLSRKHTFTQKNEKTTALLVCPHCGKELKLTAEE